MTLMGRFLEHFNSWMPVLDPGIDTMGEDRHPYQAAVADVPRIRQTTIAFPLHRYQ
jgi:hypothetical protein